MADELGEDPQWYKDAVVYQLHVKAFADSDGDGIGDFSGLTGKLDYIQELGVTAVWLLPFYPSPLRDDGYDIGDYEGIHPNYGDKRAFRRFLRGAHARGLRVITELVINHTSDEHPWFQRARRAPPGSSQRDFYVWSDTPEPYGETRIIFQDFETSNWAWDPVAGQYYWHRFYSHQPDLNFDNPEVHKAVFKVLDQWLDMGVDGVRLDAVPYLYEREGTNCENLPETHDFLRKLRSHVDESYPDRMLLAEANQWPEDAVAYFGDGDECHMAFHFPVMPRLYMALQMEDRHPLVEIMEQTPQIPDSSQWAMFLRNHDELTLEMVTDEERDYMYRSYARDPQMRVNLGIRRRLAPLLQNDRRKIELLNALLFSLPGTPILYYGDEIGMGDNVYLGDRDAVRTPMQWSPDRNAGFSPANPQRLFLPVIIDPEYHFETVNVEAQRSNPSSLWWWMHRLVALRNRHQVFGRGELEFLDPENSKVLTFLRKPADGDDGDEILVVANLSRNAQAVELNLSDHDGKTPVELFGHTPFAPIGELPYYLTLAPYGFFWFRLEPAPDAEGAVAPTPEPAVVNLSGSANLTAGRPRSSLEKALQEWLPSRRWFAGHSQTIRSVSIVDSMELGDNRSDWPVRLLLVSVEYAQGEPETYFVPVAAVEADPSDGERPNPDLVIARIRRRGDESDRLLVDAVADSAVSASLVQLAARRRTRRGNRGEARGWSTPAMRRRSFSGAEVTPMAAEQSNTSLMVGDEAILKLYRRLGEGISPDQEIGHHLNEKGFANAASLLGSVEYWRRGSEPTTLVVIHELVPNEGDAWALTLDRLAGFYEKVLTLSDETPERSLFPKETRSFDAEEVPAGFYDLAGQYLSLAELLGQRTAEMHAALADSVEPSFQPETFTRLYQRSLYQSLQSELRRTMRALRSRRGQLPDDVLERFDALDEEQLQARLDAVRSSRIVAERTRVHGDYHLGQVLWDGEDFVIIDFEGEPSRSVGQRRLKQSPLRDVAGMLRSFEYATHVGMNELVARGHVENVETARIRLGPWATLWRDWVTGRYMTGYLTAAVDHTFVPGDPSDLRLLLDAFLLEKACYEVRYELDHRPDWVGIPLEALRELAETFSPTGGGD